MRAAQAQSRNTLQGMIESQRRKALAGDATALELYDALIVDQALQLALSANTDRMLIALRDRPDGDL